MIPFWARVSLVAATAVVINVGLLLAVSLLCLNPQDGPAIPLYDAVDLVFTTAPKPEPEKKQEPEPEPEPPEEYRAPTPEPKPVPMPAIVPPEPAPTPQPAAAQIPQQPADPSPPAAPARTAKSDAYYELSQVDEPPSPIHQPPPAYPKDARRRRITGLVELRFMVETDGRVKRIIILSSEPRGVFDESVRRAVSGWRFSPGMVKGQAVRTWMRIPIRFQLR